MQMASSTWEAFRIALCQRMELPALWSGHFTKPPHSSKTSTLCAPWKKENTGFALIQIYYGGHTIASLLLDLREILGWNLGIQNYSMLNLQPHLLRGQPRHQVEKGGILPQTAYCWTVPSDLPTNNSTLQGWTERGHRSKEEVLVHFLISLGGWY